MSCLTVSEGDNDRTVSTEGALLEARLMRQDMSMGEQAVIFDYYGTLAFLDAGRHSMWQYLQREMNIEVSIEELDRRWFETTSELGPEGKAKFITLCDSWADRGAKLLQELNLPPDGRLISELYNSAHAEASLFPEVRQCLVGLRANYRVGLLSNADRSHLMTSLESNDLTFDCVAYSEQLRSYKPNANAFLSICRAMSIEPCDAVYVGDSPAADVGGAHGAGLRAVWINRFGNEWPNSIGQPDAQVESLDALSSVMEGLFVNE